MRPQQLLGVRQITILCEATADNVLGFGRGATGFTTRSYSGPARSGPVGGVIEFARVVCAALRSDQRDWG